MKALALELLRVVSLCDQVKRHHVLGPDAVGQLFRADLDQPLNHKVIGQDKEVQPFTKAGIFNLESVSVQEVQDRTHVSPLDSLDHYVGLTLSEAVLLRQH